MDQFRLLVRNPLFALTAHFALLQMAWSAGITNNKQEARKRRTVETADGGLLPGPLDFFNRLKAENDRRREQRERNANGTVANGEDLVYHERNLTAKLTKRYGKPSASTLRMVYVLKQTQTLSKKRKRPLRCEGERLKRLCRNGKRRYICPSRISPVHAELVRWIQRNGE